MISLQSILLLLTLISSGCKASPLLHQSSSFAIKHINRKRNAISTTRHTRSVAFMVIPRGGGGDGLDNDDDGHLEESSDDINDTEIDESEEYDIIEDGDVGDEEDGESLDSTSLDDDDASFSPSKFSFFSSSTSKQSATGNRHVPECCSDFP